MRGIVTKERREEIRGAVDGESRFTDRVLIHQYDDGDEVELSFDELRALLDADERLEKIEAESANFMRGFSEDDRRQFDAKP